MKEQTEPWDTKGRIIAGDFIRVLQGELVGKEGFVKDCNDSYELVVEETSKDLSQPLVILEGGYPKVQGDRVSAWLHLFHHVLISGRQHLPFPPR